MSESMSTQPQDAVPNRRPRVREASSRFMNSTPVPSGEHPTLHQPVKTPKHSVSTPMPAQKTMMQRSKTDNPYHHQHQEIVIRGSPLTLHNYNNILVPNSTRPRGASTRLVVLKENKGVKSGEGSDTDDDGSEAVPQLRIGKSSGLSLSSSAPKERIGDGKGTGSNSEDDEDGCSTKSCPNSPVPVSLPPTHPMPVTKQGDATRKGRKVFNREEQVHSLKMLHNRHLQWNFVNAKSEASFRAQTRDAEGKLFCLGTKISDLSEVVRRKRMELEYLKRIETLTTIVEAQTPYLDEWSALEEEHSSSLSGTTQALVNSLDCLPVSGNVQVDIKEVGEDLNSAMKLMEMISVNVEKFIPKASDMDTLSSELARSVAGERVLIDECGDLLLKTHTSQVEECSLRGQLMQLKKSNPVLQQ